MSEYTKEQEAEALERAAQYSDMESRPYWRVVLAMAKRTAEAEARADASEADAKRLADDWVAVLLERDALKTALIDRYNTIMKVTAERDALKARVSELNKRPWIDGTDIVQGEHEADCGLVGYTLTYVEPLQRRVAELEAKAAPTPVVVTREVVEALSEFARTWARFGADCEPENAAARLVVAVGEALEAKP